MENKKTMISEESYIEKYIRPNGSIGYRTINNDVSEANPDGLEESNINNVLKNYHRTGVWPSSGKEGYYEEEIIPPSSLIEAHEIIKRSQEKFDSLPSHVREQFNNDPTELHYFLSNLADPNDIAVAKKLGLISGSVQNDDPNDDPKEPPKPPKKQPKPPIEDPA